MSCVVDAAVRGLLVEKIRDQSFLFAAVSACLKQNDQDRASVLLQRILDVYQCQFTADFDTASILKCAIRLHLAVIEKTKASDEHVGLAMLSSVFRYAARFSHDCNEAGSAAKCSMMDRRWFQRTAFNTVQHYANTWPHKFLIDILQHGMEIIAYSPASAGTVDTTSAENMVIAEHQVNSTFLLGLLFAAQARQWDPVAGTLEDLPRTSYSSRFPPSPSRLQCHLYQEVSKSFRRLTLWYNERQEVGSTNDAIAAVGTSPTNLGTDIQSKAGALLPLAFEAELFLALFDMQKPCDLDLSQLNLLFDDASQLASSSTVYAVIADLILRSTLENEHESERDFRTPARLPLNAAVELLGRVITVTSAQPDYDVAKAARWIRCVVQTILDANTAFQSGPSINSKSNTYLDLLDAMTTEAIQLARSATRFVNEYLFHRPDDMDLDHRDTEDAPPEPYPADELQWLSTTLFNLAVDLWVGGLAEDAQKWAATAVEVADVLRSMHAADGGDEGELSAKLRERGEMVGWVL
jgi:hypothetical protein